MPWNEKNTPSSWSEPRELFPGVFEKAKYNASTGRFENIIYQEGGERHFHGFIDPAKNQAGGGFNEND